MNFDMLPTPNLCFCMSKFSFKYTNELLYVIATVLLVSLTKPMKKYGICRSDPPKKIVSVPVHVNTSGLYFYFLTEICSGIRPTSR